MWKSPENTYWNHKGTHAQFIDALEALVPYEGSVPQPHKNKALERFRKASNYYYDLYNNGLFNRARGFTKMFGVSSYHFVGQRYVSAWCFEEVEKRMDEIVLAAAIEQKLVDTSS